MGLAKAIIRIEHTGEEIPVLFNPEEYSINHDNNFASQTVPGLSAPVLQFVNGNMRTLDMELFFDTTAERIDVREETGKVVGLLDIDSELHAPPVLEVSWGSLYFRCVLASAGQQFVKFLDDGRPVRARINVTFNEFVDPRRESREVNRQTTNFSKVYVAAEGDDLASLAARFLDNPRVWRAIAIENDIDDPQADLTGMSLRIPSLPYLNPETGEVLA
ncbi:MAG: peptigoglycan-binding protein LysM [bacterium]|nr:peptigoglycan-binding protein LysM [bacterium]